MFKSEKMMRECFFELLHFWTWKATAAGDRKRPCGQRWRPRICPFENCAGPRRLVWPPSSWLGCAKFFECRSPLTVNREIGQEVWPHWRGALAPRFTYHLHRDLTNPALASIWAKHGPRGRILTRRTSMLPAHLEPWNWPCGHLCHGRARVE